MWLLGKSGPACRRDTRKHKVICSRWSPTGAPQGHPKSNKKLGFAPKVGAKLMRRSLGVLLAQFWVRFGIRVARKSRKRCIVQPLLTTFKLFEFVAFTNTLYFTSFLTTVGLLQSSSSLRVSQTLMTQPSRQLCNLLAFWLLSGPANSSRNSSDKPFP